MNATNDFSLRASLLAVMAVGVGTLLMHTGVGSAIQNDEAAVRESLLRSAKAISC